MSTHKEKLIIILKYKNLLSKYGDIIVSYLGIPFLIIYAIINSMICMLALVGASTIERTSDLFIQYPLFIPFIIASLNILMILPFIIIIIYFIYMIMKLLENHYTKMSEREIK
jgi:hypothetical protein